MASIKVKFRESTQPNREGAIYYQLIHNKVVKQLGAKYKIYADEWSEESAQIAIPHIDSQRQQYLYIIRDRIKLELVRLQKIVDNLTKRGGEYSVNDIISTFER